MEVVPGGWTIQQFMNMIKSYNIVFDYPSQRDKDQWNLQKQSELIDSSIIDLPIPPLYFYRFYEKRQTASKLVPVRKVIDGTQRLTTFYSYINNEFALIQTLPPRQINGVDYVIAGKKFEELEQSVQDTILGKYIAHYTMDADKVTPEEIDLVLSRLNNGAPMTTAQKLKSYIGHDFAQLLNEAGKHVAVQKLSNFNAGQFRRNEHQLTIMQAMMILENWDYKSFSAKEVTRYSETFKDSFEDRERALNKAIKGMDYLAEVFTEKEKFLLKKISFPMTVSLAYEASETGVEPDVFYLWSTAFVDSLEDENSAIPNDYMIYTKNGSTDIKKVRGRIDAMRNHFYAYLEYANKKESVANES